MVLIEELDEGDGVPTSAPVRGADEQQEDSAGCNEGEHNGEEGSGEVAAFHDPEELTDEEKRFVEDAERRKQEGNAFYGQGKYEEAKACYSQALELAPDVCSCRAVYYANRAACELKLEQHKDAAKDCTEALKLDKKYLKALLRRSEAYERIDELDRAYEDAKKVLEDHPGNPVAQRTVRRLEPEVLKRREEMKEEMIGKLKDMGNAVLGKFGLSLDNFKTEKDPTTGSYSIKFQQ
eukprot:evm.model.scf_3710.1 EVM.evm.TU.scf_3710.1   scf_3710:4658-7154(+)